MRRLLVCLFLVLAGPAVAVEPGEMLADPALEARARDISSNLRCLVCRNESIDESHADLARDLRLLVRERLLAGDTDEEVFDFVVSRFGEYVLLTPRASGSNLLLWFAGPIMLVVGGAVAFFVLGRRTASPEDRLSPDEQARLDELMGK